ncbi:MAG: indole-3-glycerol phosphate synthase TrpC [Candidatus Peregrinibacteria bacterium]|nr:indole-3-glycerol phosphate synthase TrpC [Candidatus Peregrinibacteria bacterium]
MNVLQKIIENKRTEIAGMSCDSSGLERSKRSFFDAISKNDEQELPNFITEIKKVSPAKGAIFQEVDVVRLAKIYEVNGAATISVLTDKKFFGGNVEDLKNVSENVSVPVLRKGFILDKSQIYEARKAGADAVLLMTQVLSEDEIREFLLICYDLGMDALVEVFDENNLETAVRAGAKIIGVNSRDFNAPDLKLDRGNFAKILPQIPKGIVRVALSGVSNVDQVREVAPMCDAVLVGTSLMQLRDYKKIGEKVREFCGK